LIFWLVIAAMTVAALALVLTPLVLRHRRAPRRVEFHMAIYRDQLDELENDRARGLVGKDQSEAARLEIQRRMLAAAKRDGGDTADTDATEQVATPGSAVRRWLVMASVGAAVPALAVALYLALGSPGTPGQPFSGVAQQGGGASGQDMAGQTVEAAIANLAQRLEQNPNDLQGWLLLGRSLISLNRHAEAAQAFATAVRLSNGDPDIIGSMAEALVFAAEGIVTADALTAFETVLGVNPDDPAAQYYIGISLTQQGRPGEALDMWRKLAAETPADALWRGNLVTWMRRAAKETGIELGSIPSAPASARQPGPSQDDVAAAADMSPEERTDMIRSMVAQLAARLVEEPDDLEGWERLASSYRVLGENAKAAAAEQRATELEAGNAQSGPSQEDIAAAQDMSPDDQSKMIGAMVEQLAERLGENPDDLQGWLRLGRSYSVLGRHGESRGAFARAAKLAPGDSEILRAYARAVMNAAGTATEFPELAIELYGRILELDPAHWEGLWFMGLAEASAGRPEGAREFWTRLLELLPAGGADRDVVERALGELPN
jgi:cytochrome c-type biogenesis protein CcmH